MDVVNGDHVTLAYKPNNKTFKKLNKLIGKKVDVYVNQIRANNNIEALWVSDMYLNEPYKKLKRVDKGSPHITISHKKDFKYGDAISMFNNPTYTKNIQADMLKGKIKWISYE